MPPKQIKTTGIDQCLNELKKFSPNDSVFILFCGSKTPDGESWCPDCVKAEPFIMKAVNKLPESDVFIYCDVGPRNEWKDPKNPFRTNEQFKLTAVPTFMKWNTPKRLVEGQCWDDGMLALMFEDD